MIAAISISWFDIWNIAAPILNALFIITVAFIIIVVILENKNPLRTISWLIVLLLLPVIGIIFYLYFGRSIRKRKSLSKKEKSDLEGIEAFTINQLGYVCQKEFLQNSKIKSKANIMRLMHNNSKALLTQKNKVKVLNNGLNTYDSITCELEKAQHHIHLEYYIFENDQIGNEIKEILIRKTLEGVKVRFIYDDIGSWDLDDEFIEELKNAGIEVYSFMPVKYYFLANRVNYRNHRKIIVIDGNIGFVGGLNIADKYLKGDDELGFWRDTHLRLEGDATKMLQTIFLIDWFFVSEKLIQDQIYFPTTNITDDCYVQITSSGPDSDWASIMQSYFSAITSAQKNIYISMPYFLPNESILTALKTASLSGVDVKIIIPQKADNFLITWGTHSYVEELLEAGINIYFYKKGFIHSKIMIVDDIFSSVGTANMDIRSFDQNFEINALIYNENITSNLTNAFNKDLQDSEKINLEEFEHRAKLERIKESFAKLFSPLL